MRKISITETELADLITIGAKMVLNIKHPEFGQRLRNSISGIAI